MMMSNIQPDDVLSATTILRNRLKTKQMNATRKALSFGLIAVSLAACGGTSGETADEITETTPITSGGDSATDTSEEVVTSQSDQTQTPVKVALEISNANDTAQLEGSNFNTFDAVFHVSASFDAANVQGLQTINLGIDASGAEMASQGRADFDSLSAETTTLNVFASQRDIELDFKRDSDADIDINFKSETGETTVGASHTGIHILNSRTVTISQDSDFDVTIGGATNINGQTEHLIVRNDGALGHLNAGLDARVAAVEEGGALKTVLVDITEGGASLAASNSIHGNGAWIDDITNLQTYTIKGHDGELNLGSVGNYGQARDLETISINLTGNAFLNHDEIFADDSKISHVEVSGSFNEGVTVSTFYLSGTFNIHLDSLFADKIVQLEVAADEGAVLLNNQRYEVGDVIFSGTGDIVIRGDEIQSGIDDGFIQTSAADASDHSGDRLFISGTGLDVFYGSSGDDTITFNSFGFDTDVYNDAGGDDLINIEGSALVIINDGSAGSDDIVNAVGGFGFLTPRVIFNAGSGDDFIEFASFGFGFGPKSLIDFGSYISGTVEIENFNGSLQELSFDGLDGITTTTTTVIDAGLSLTNGRINDNTIYVLQNGDIPVSGVSVSNYVDLGDVATFLNQMASNAHNEGDTAVFVINNGTTTTAAGDSHDAYFYQFTENGEGIGVSESEITLLGMSSSAGFIATPITVNDIV